MFSVEMLPAGHGDALWIEYGPEAQPYRVLIDGGTSPTYEILRPRLHALPAGQKRLELLVVTHIDRDHIDGALRLVQDRALDLHYGDIWFNAWRHLVQKDELGPVQGEQLSRALRERRLCWNCAFGGEAVVVPEAGPLPSVELAGGLKLTLLSPYRHHLTDLAYVWEAALAGTELDPRQPTSEPNDQLGKDELAEVDEEEDEPPDLLGSSALDLEDLAGRRFVEDVAVPNGSSIAFLAEYQGRRVLLGADAFPSVLADSLQRLPERTAALRLDAAKLSHHGSRKNTSPDLLDQLTCPSYLISTNGCQYRHPNPETLARVICRNGAAPGVQLCFNYRSPINAVWSDPQLQEQYDFVALYPPEGTAGYRLAW
jgi:hypothetical protein